jgi:type IV pilus assembly protein PilF
MKKIISLFIVFGLFCGCAAKTGNSGISPEKAEMAESRYKMSVAYLNSGVDHQAYNELKAALDIDPNNDKYLYTMGIFFMKQNRFAEAEGYLRKAININSEAADYQNALATTLASTGRLDEALTYWNKVIKDPGYQYHIVALYNAATALYDNERYKQVPYYLNKALEINRRYSAAYDLLFKTYVKLGDSSKAEETLLKSAQMIPESMEYKLKAAEFYFEQAKYGKAVPFLKEILDTAPDSPEAMRAEDLMKRLGLINE